ncbi:MAG TPA: alkaline phosphatase family protein, partial [Micrococcaceae bacterium]
QGNRPFLSAAALHAAGLLAVVLTLAGCAATGPTGGSPLPDTGAARATAGQGQGAARASGGAPAGKIAHVVIIMEENKAQSHILGSTAAPFINKLAQANALAANYEAVAHPSLPNYLTLTSGTNAGITNDCNPPGGACTASVRSIADQIQQAGRSWKMYAESMPAPCSPDNSGRYAVKHNPFMYYPNVTGNGASCAAHDVPFAQFAGDLTSASSLPDYSFISPDLCNDMHDCSIETGDAWLSKQVPAILASPAFTTQNSLLVITFDEGDNHSNKVFTVFAGPAARKGFTSSTAYTHYSLLHTVEDAWGMAPLTTGVRDSAIMADMLR